MSFTVKVTERKDLSASGADGTPLQSVDQTGATAEMTPLQSQDVIVPAPSDLNESTPLQSVDNPSSQEPTDVGTGLSPLND